MFVRSCLVFLLSITLVLGSYAAIPDLGLKRINPETTLIGQEHTAQDQAMVDEPGRSSGPTEHRWAKLRAFVDAFKVRMKVKKKKDVRERHEALDPGFYVKTEFGEYRINMEPVTIEVNSPPPNIYQLRDYATPIYQTYEEIGLVPYIRAAGERSGMGHAHIGGATLKESPFFLFPNLLPNLMVYLHNNPAALFALSEAYDMGRRSNMETYHYEPKQKEFNDAIEEFHEWWKKNPKKRADFGLFKFVSIMKKTSLDPTEHYRYINFERFRSFGTSKSDVRSQKEETARTVEVRVIRPYKTVDHAEAVGMYLLKLLDYLSDPKMLLKIQPVTRESFQYYYSGTEIAANWEKVKADIGFDNPLVNEMVQEYVDNVRMKTYTAQGLPKGAAVSAAYSLKEEKGQRYEVRLPAKKTEVDAPALALNGLQIPLKKIRLDNKLYWVGIFHLADYKIPFKELVEGSARFIVGEEAAKLPMRVIKGDRAPKDPPKPKPVVVAEVARGDRPVAPQLISAKRAIEILTNPESTPEATRAAYNDFLQHAQQVNSDFILAPITDDFARSLLRADSIFVQMKGFLHFFENTNVIPSEDDLKKISKALDNARFTDRQIFYSRLAAKMLYTYRADKDNFSVMLELSSTLRFDSDGITKAYAVVAYLANGGRLDRDILRIVPESLKYLSEHREKPRMQDTTALIDYLLQVTDSTAPHKISRGPVFSCRAVFY